MNKLQIYQNKSLDQLRTQADPLADNAVQFLMANSDWAVQLNEMNELPEPDLLPEPLKDFFAVYYTMPTWIESKKVLQAQDFFDKEGSLYLSMLGFYSLPYCYAFADGAQVLIRSKRITDDIGLRLSETALFVLDCFHPDTFLGNTKGLLTIAKVRLIHAFSRYFVQFYAKDWDPKWGVAINQEDLLGTNLAFSLLVLRGFDKVDKIQGKDTLEAILHYWKLIGYFLGIDSNYLPETAKEAFELEKLIRERHMRYSEAGEKLMTSLLNFYKQAIPDPAVSKVVVGVVSFFIGRQASDALNLPSSGIPRKELVRFIFEYSYLRQNGLTKSYQITRSQFRKRNREVFDKEVKLSLPVMKRS